MIFYLVSSSIYKFWRYMIKEGFVQSKLMLVLIKIKPYMMKSYFINLQQYLVINIWTSSHYNTMHVCYVCSGTIVLATPKISEFRPIS